MNKRKLSIVSVFLCCALVSKSQLRMVKYDADKKVSTEKKIFKAKPADLKKFEPSADSRASFGAQKDSVGIVKDSIRTNLYRHQIKTDTTGFHRINKSRWGKGN